MTLKIQGKKSISDNQNYGDDVNAQYLLYPPQFAAQGVEDEEFVQPRSRREIREIFEKIGHSFSDNEFDRIWESAACNCDLNADGIVSVQEFRSALNDYLDA